MATDVAIQDRSLALSPTELLQGSTTCVALTVLAYARMTGADPLFQFVWRSRIGSGLLFALAAAAAIASLSLVIGAKRAARERVVQVVYLVATSAVALAIGSALLALSVNPGEILRFFAAPISLPMLVLIVPANLLLGRRTKRTTPYTCANWPPELLLAFGAILAAVGIHLATNLAAVEALAIQVLLILLGGVAPSLGFMTAFMSLLRAGRTGSMASLVAAAGSCAMIAALSSL